MLHNQIFRIKKLFLFATCFFLCSEFFSHACCEISKNFICIFLAEQRQQEGKKVFSPPHFELKWNLFMGHFIFIFQMMMIICHFCSDEIQSLSKRLWPFRSLCECVYVYRSSNQFTDSFNTNCLQRWSLALFVVWAREGFSFYGFSVRHQKFIHSEFIQMLFSIRELDECSTCSLAVFAWYVFICTVETKLKCGNKWWNAPK